MRLVVMPFMEQPTQYTLILSGLIVLSVTCNGLRRILSEFLAVRCLSLHKSNYLLINQNSRDCRLDNHRRQLR